MLADSAERVCSNTSHEVNERIRRQTEQSIPRAASEGALGVERRLHELDEEWDVERCLETMAPTITLIGLTLGVTVNKKFLLIPAIV